MASFEMDLTGWMEPPDEVPDQIHDLPRAYAEGDHDDLPNLTGKNPKNCASCKGLGFHGPYWDANVQDHVEVTCDACGGSGKAGVSHP